MTLFGRPPWFLQDIHGQQVSPVTGNSSSAWAAYIPEVQSQLAQERDVALAKVAEEARQEETKLRYESAQQSFDGLIQDFVRHMRRQRLLIFRWLPGSWELKTTGYSLTVKSNGTWHAFMPARAYQLLATYHSDDRDLAFASKNHRGEITDQGAIDSRKAQEAMVKYMLERNIPLPS